jgi:hypothetical protein
LTLHLGGAGLELNVAAFHCGGVFLSHRHLHRRDPIPSKTARGRGKFWKRWEFSAFAMWQSAACHGGEVVDPGGKGVRVVEVGAVWDIRGLRARAK